MTKLSLCPSGAGELCVRPVSFIEIFFTMLRQLIHSEEINIRNKPVSMNQHRSCSLCLWRDVCHGISDPRRQRKVDYNVYVASASELGNYFS